MKRRIIFSILFILFALIFGFVVWAFTPSNPTSMARNALLSDSQVMVKTTSNWVEFSPFQGSPQTGFIFYPGGHVDYQAYAPLLRPIAAQGYLVVLAQMPLSLAVLAPESASQIIDAFPDVHTWAIGGHSLGGAMAAHYVFKYPQKVQGLVLWASYPSESESLSGISLPVLSVYGTRDGLAAQDKILASASLLPAGTRWVPIEGGNHAQFGSYGAQSGDNAAAISPEQQHQLVAQATLEFLSTLKQP